jgi:hypothetical protein
VQLFERIAQRCGVPLDDDPAPESLASSTATKALVGVWAVGPTINTSPSASSFKTPVLASKSSSRWAAVGVKVRSASLAAGSRILARSVSTAVPVAVSGVDGGAE